MSEERLQEIKDSISLQYKVQEANDLNNFNIFTDEEQELVEEIERLNNIINELEKYINETKLEEFEKEYGRRYGKTFTQAEVIICNMILNKLQELKGSDSNVKD